MTWAEFVELVEAKLEEHGQGRDIKINYIDLSPEVLDRNDVDVYADIPKDGTYVLEIF